jgi:hypothetical protein
VFELGIANLKAIEEDGFRGGDADICSGVPDEIGGEADDEGGVLFVETPVARRAGRNNVDVAVYAEAAVSLATALTTDLDRDAVVNDEEGIRACGALQDASWINLKVYFDLLGRHENNCRTRERH